MSKWQLNFHFTEVCQVIEHCLNSFVLKLRGSVSSHAAGAASHPSGLFSPLPGPCQLDKHCQKEFLGVKLACPASFNSALFIYVFIKFVLKWGESSPFFLLLNKVCYAKRDFTASLLALCELPASIWSGDGCSVAKSISARLFSPTLTHTLPVYPLLSQSPSSSQYYVTRIHTAQTPVMQYDLFSYQLLTLSTISGLSWHQYTHTHAHTEAKVF